MKDQALLFSSLPDMLGALWTRGFTLSLNECAAHSTEVARAMCSKDARCSARERGQRLRSTSQSHLSDHIFILDTVHPTCSLSFLFSTLLCLQSWNLSSGVLGACVSPRAQLLNNHCQLGYTGIVI